tara:strand:+ start:461 stop:1165 length:705 start_codon:yes stop_codon:yes gene_type:complete
MENSIKLITCVSIKYDIDLIYHFCKHYSKFNIDSHHFILHNDADFELTEYLELFLLIKSSELTFEKWVGEFNCIEKIGKFNKIITNSKESHILLTDIDEFQNHVIPIQGDYIWGDLVDREPEGMKVKKVTAESIALQFPIKSKISKWNNSIKPCLFPSTERLLSSHFITKQYNNENTIEVDHYRWTNTRLLKSRERYNIHARLNKENITFPGGFPVDAKESRRVVSRLETKTAI